ncbi:membrane protein DedA with SNARE-associated domain [Planomicrobium sp. HSC-17F08]|nr:membrane protein DedA with SNARE-associated domain [Planomicrobium sp. HSC-17F08]
MLVEQLLAFLESLGLSGLLAAMFLEGSSLPFPGVVLVIAYGGLLNLNFGEAALLSIALAATYSAASLIPYFLGKKMHALLPKSFTKGLHRASDLFRRYGIWSIALSRPFGIGNYISYVAGMSKIGIVQYLLLTFVGIYPWCLAMLCIGAYVNGNYEVFQSLYSDHQLYVYGAVSATGALGLVLYARFRKVNRLIDKSKSEY